VQFWELRRLPMLHVSWQPAMRTARRMAPRGSIPSRCISTFQPSSILPTLLGGVLYNLHRVEGRELAVAK